MNRDGDTDRSLGKLEAIAIVLRDIEIISHQVELLAGHAKGGMIIDFHARDSSAPTRSWKHGFLRWPA
jgi:hypothetical protein